MPALGANENFIFYIIHGVTRILVVSKSISVLSSNIHNFINNEPNLIERVFKIMSHFIYIYTPT